jgi:hypothetical protein
MAKLQVLLWVLPGVGFWKPAPACQALHVYLLLLLFVQYSTCLEVLPWPPGLLALLSLDLASQDRCRWLLLLLVAALRWGRQQQAAAQHQLGTWVSPLMLLLLLLLRMATAMECPAQLMSGHHQRQQQQQQQQLAGTHASDDAVFLVCRLKQHDDASPGSAAAFGMTYSPVAAAQLSRWWIRTAACLMIERPP